ncbi:glutamate--tRNA ligase [Nannocystaceae bacterium ST9]
MATEASKGPDTGDLGRLPPRVRIAPSPTGDPHVGTAYIGLFNWVFARKHGGKFILRIEDTDQERSTAGSERAILAALRWLGLDWDEGPDVGGPFGPYRQSERLPLYAREVQSLLDRGAAYRCFCTRERLEQVHQHQVANKLGLGYDRHCRNLDPDQAKARAEAGEVHVVRLAIPLSGETVVADGLRGNIVIANHTIDDQVLMKSDGFPTYHLANVVDDHHMGITHVIRGEEWITSTPKHILLYQAFGWEPPRWYHLNLLRNFDKSKLSKRKNPVSIDYYRALGYMPSTLLNFLGTLGFSMGGDVERFTLQEMIDNFSWERVAVGSPVFDQAKLEAFSGQDIRALDPEALLAEIRTHVLADERLRALLVHTRERISRLDDFVPYVSCFFGGSLDYGPVADKLRIKKRSRAEIVDILATYVEDIERDHEAREFSVAGLEQFSNGFCDRHGWKRGDLFMLLRIAAVGRTAAPPIFDTLQLVGKDRFRQRVRDVIALLLAGEDFTAEGPVAGAGVVAGGGSSLRQNKGKK